MSVILFIYFYAYGIVMISCDHVTIFFFNKFYFMFKLLFIFKYGSRTLITIHFHMY